MDASSSADRLDLLSTPFAILTGDALTVVTSNRAAAEWLGLAPGDALRDRLPAIDTPQVARLVGRRRKVTVASSARLRRGALSPVEYVLNPAVLDGAEGWILEGRDTSRVAEKQALLESYAEIIERKNAEIDASNRQMRLVLDNVEQGLLVVDATGCGTGARSAAIDRWFGSPEGLALPEYLGRIDPSVEDWLALGFDPEMGVFGGVVPLELAIDQLPKSMQHGNAHYRLQYQPIEDADGVPRSLLIMVIDVTDEVRRHEAEALQRDVLRAVEHLVQDRAGFVQFAEEMDDALTRLSDDDLDVIDTLRILHTLKGNSALFGIERLSRLCHALEQDCLDRRTRLTDAERSRLRKAWDQVADRLWAWLHGSKKGVELDRSEHEHLIEDLRRRVPHQQLLRWVMTWSGEPVSHRLGHLAAGARELAMRLGKGDIAVEVETTALRVPSKAWRDLSGALNHIVRNAVAHGVEAPEDRQRLGKPPRATIRLTARVDGEVLELSVADDGRGIDWPSLAAKAQALGLPHSNRAELIEAMLADGVTTREVTDGVAGRGVGLAAVHQVCESLGGVLEVESTSGAGTRFVMRIPQFRECGLVGAVDAA